MAGCPVILNVVPATGIETRNAVPVPVWQSVQWQIPVAAGSASPSMVIAPHWHAPSILIASSLVSGLFERFHIVIRHSEMMPDLVHQHMGDDRAERIVVLGPVIEDRAAVEPDHVWHLHRRAFRAERQPDAMKQPEDVELAAQPHPVEHLVLLQRGRRSAAPGERIVGAIVHGGAYLAK